MITIKVVWEDVRNIGSGGLVLVGKIGGVDWIKIYQEGSFYKSSVFPFLDDQGIDLEMIKATAFGKIYIMATMVLHGQEFEVIEEESE